MMKNT